MAECSHDNCPHGHWSSHRHCLVPNCPYVERTGTRQGDFVDGKFVCPVHATELGAREARRLWAEQYPGVQS